MYQHRLCYSTLTFSKKYCLKGYSATLSSKLWYFNYRVDERQRLKRKGETALPRAERLMQDREKISLPLQKPDVCLYCISFTLHALFLVIILHHKLSFIGAELPTTGKKTD